MHPIWQGLLANLASVALVILLWSQVRSCGERWRALRASWLFGLAMGAGSVLAMTLSFEGAPGFFYDVRATPIAIAGLFGGPAAAAFALAPALLFRAWIGGAGAAPGCLGLAACGLTAALCHRLCSGPRAGGFALACCSVLVPASSVAAAWMFAPLGLMVSTAPPMILLNALATYLGCLTLRQEEQQRELSATNALYRAVIEALPDCLNVKDESGRFLVANPATARLMGAVSADALIGKTDFDFYPESVAQRFREDEEAVLGGDKAPHTFEQQPQFNDGGSCWLSTLKAPFCDGRGRVVGLITHNRDVTEAKRLQLQLQEAQQLLASALANMADGLVVYDRDGRIILCNEQYRALFPLTADVRVPGARLEDIVRASAARGERRAVEGLDFEALVAEIMAQSKLSGVRLFTLADGRSLEARMRPTGDGGALTIFADVTSRLRLERELQFRAEHDPLTGLANRRVFHERLEAAVARARDGEAQTALVAVDLDHFKSINDTYGHQVGDQLLLEIAARLRAACGSDDLVARLGGDEFAIVLQRADARSFGAVAQRVVETVAAPFETRGASFRPSASVGLAACPADATTPEGLIACADRALYSAKDNGRGTWRGPQTPAPPPPLLKAV